MPPCACCRRAKILHGGAYWFGSPSGRAKVRPPPISFMEIKMRALAPLLPLFLSTALFQLPAPSVGDQDRQPDIVVGVDNTQCPDATFSSIQDAVNAASSGDVIRVCRGTYAEQVVVNKSLVLDADNGAIVAPFHMAVNTTEAVSGQPLAAAILVKDATDVDIEGFIVEGADNGITECAPKLIGILYQDASGTVKHNAVRHMNLATSLNGCQSGDGIEAISSPGRSSNVTIEDNSVHDYQKNGITGNEPGTTVAIQENTVTGMGPTTGAAQNGIQVGFGAQGSVTENNVSDNIWSLCVSPQQCQFNATGILVYQSDGVAVSRNTVGTNQVGIFIGGQFSKVDRNVVFDSQVLTGIELDGNNNEAGHNRVIHSDQGAFLIQGNNNRVEGNTITEAGIGILKMLGSADNIFQRNSFFATPISVRDLAPQANAQVSPER
jgi:parallel beta-helix repeat protein